MYHVIFTEIAFATIPQKFNFKYLVLKLNDKVTVKYSF